MPNGCCGDVGGADGDEWRGGREGGKDGGTRKPMVALDVCSTVVLRSALSSLSVCDSKVVLLFLACIGSGKSTVTSRMTLALFTVILIHCSETPKSLAKAVRICVELTEVTSPKITREKPTTAFGGGFSGGEVDGEGADGGCAGFVGTLLGI